ncbi:MAG: aminopeptidase P family protein [Chthonomonadales bacterium]|nr:aminopeptidase P family protein [Chthonomonadales bacterium]
MPPEDLKGRLARARAAMAERDLPALLLTQIDNVHWISGFTGSSAQVLLTAEAALIATDSRYTEQARSECPSLELVSLASSSPDAIVAVLGTLPVGRLGFEASSVSVRMHGTLREQIPGAIELIATDRLVEGLRLVKGVDEVARIEVACGVVDRAFERIVPEIRPGATERDVMLALEWHMRRDESADVSFDTIVASGPRSALPHGRPSERVLAAGDMVTLDYGARVAGYCSDITRTVSLGRAGREEREVYHVVLDAMNRAIAAMRPGVSGRDVDAVARDHISQAGYGDFFGHGLGHSLGRAVHDGPGLAPRSGITLAPGMVMTVEPGIYLPGRFGVRIEQDVLVTEDGARVLTHSPSHLMELPA